MGRPQITAVIPAAGLSSRMGVVNKLLLDVEGLPMIVRVVRTVLQCRITDVVVVTGYDSVNVAAVLTSMPVRIVNNPLYSEGMGSSLIQGIRSAAASDGYLIWPGDMPFIKPETVAAICEAHDKKSIIVPVHQNRRGHPVLFGTEFKDSLLNILSESGARSILDDNPDSVIEVEVEDSAILRDLDTPRDISDLGQV